MKEPIVLIGIGEMAGVFARGLLKQGHPLIPVTRETDMDALSRELPAPRLVLVTVGEKDLHPLLATIPAPWKSRLGLLQNELLPRDWQAHGVTDPSVIAVWFEKKKGQDAKVLVPSPAFGPSAPLLADALGALGIPASVLPNEEALLFELVRKNVYILTTNIAGLETDGTVDELWRQHEALAREVADEVMDIQFRLVGQTLDRERLMAGMLEGFEGDPQHRCMGRSAPERLQRALQHADREGLAVPRLHAIAQRHLAGG